MCRGVRYHASVLWGRLMTDAQLLELLKSDLGEPNASATRVLFLEQKIREAKSFIEQEGIKLTVPYSYEDAGLVIMYAAFLVRKRATSEGLPRYLRWALNNRLMHEKGRVENV